MPNCQVTRKRCARGTASVEAVIALPVFVVLFIGLFFVRELTGAKLEADRHARSCAWAYAMNNCEHIPAGCAGVLLVPSSGAPDAGFEAKLREAENGMRSGEGSGVVMKILRSIVLDAVTSSVTKKFDATKPLQRERPNLFGGGKSQVIGKYRLSCNLPSKTQQQFAEDVWHTLVP